ncbi:MAG TPA: tetratricopeptide repeat protein [Candidatus Nanopelagicales bacterium]|nr:tetratricopeptide repeat protein [Candidatus Nanopelagicales bacterium]
MLILVDRATDARLEELVRALVPEHPELEVYTEPQDLADAPVGSTHVLAARAEHAGWLNLQRPIFAERALKVVLWCDEETSAGLARKAPDFFDWIGHRVECPAGVARFAVRGLRCALRCRAPGIVWRDNGTPVSGDTDFPLAFREALPGRPLLGCQAAWTRTELAGAFRSAGRAWCYVGGVRTEATLEKIVDAMKDARRRGRVVVVNPSVDTSGWWPVDGQTHPLREARHSLAQAGFPHPGRLAALCGLEPSALSLVSLLRRRAGMDAVMVAVQSAWDPGASLARLAEQHGMVDLMRFTLGGHPRPVVWRALAADLRIRRLQGAGLARIFGPLPVTSHGERALERARYLARAMLLVYPPLAHEGLHEPEARALLSEIEGIVGADHPMQAQALGLLAQSIASQGRYEEAEAYLRRALATQQARLRSEDPDTLWTCAHLASVLAAEGRHAEARPLAAWVLKTWEELLGPTSRNTSLALAHFAAVRHALGEPGAADDARRALAMLPPDDPDRDELSDALRHIIAGA